MIAQRGREMISLELRERQVLAELLKHPRPLAMLPDEYLPPLQLLRSKGLVWPKGGNWTPTENGEEALRLEVSKGFAAKLAKLTSRQPQHIIGATFFLSNRIASRRNATGAVVLVARRTARYVARRGCAGRPQSCHHRRPTFRPQVRRLALAGGGTGRPISRRWWWLTALSLAR